MTPEVRKRIDEIQRQLTLCRQLDNISGVAFYRYGSCKNNEALNALLRQTFEDADYDIQLSAIKEAYWQKSLSLVSPISTPGESMMLEVTAPLNSRVTVYHQDAVYTLRGKNCNYTGTFTVPQENTSAPLLLVSETNGLVQVKLTTDKTTVTETPATVKHFDFSDTADSHVLQLTLDHLCRTNLSLRQQALTEVLVPYPKALLLEAVSTVPSRRAPR